MSGVKASPGLPARYIGQLVDYLDSIGVDRGGLLRAAKIRSVDSPESLVSVRQLETLLTVAERATGRLDLGLELGRRLDPTSHDVVGFALLTSPTFGHFVRLAVTYQRLMQPFFSLSMQARDGRVELVYRPVVALPARTLRVLEEAIVASNYTGFRTALGDRLRPWDAWLSIETPAHARRYREFKGLRVRFGDTTPGLRIAVDRALFDAPLALANPRAMRSAEERCRVMLRRTGTLRRWSEWCRMMLRESEDSRPTLEQLARMMNISPRTLARYLAAEHASFRDLSLEVRTARAQELLAAGELSATQVAYRLGYTDLASFVRSFRARTGRTPGSFRAATRSAPVCLAADGTALSSPLTSPAARIAC